MKLNFKNVNKEWKTYALAGCCCVACFVVLMNLGTVFGFIKSFFSVFKTVFVGAIIAYIANPLVKFFDEKILKKISKEKLRWTLSVVIATLILVAIVIALLALIIPQVVDSILFIVDRVSKFVTNLQASSEGIDTQDNIVLEKLRDYLLGEDGLVERFGTIVTDNMQTILKATTSIGSTAASGGIGVILAIYFLMAKNSVKSVFKRLFSLILSPVEFYNSSMVVNKFNLIFSNYIVCEILDSLLVGVLNYVFMVIVGMPSAAFISVVVAVTNLAPTFGPLVGAAFGVLVLMLFDTSYILPFLIFTAVLQTIDGYVVKPKLFGEALNVPGLLILISIIVFGNVFGVGGILISIPVAAILVYFYTEAFIPWLELRKDMKKYQKEVNKGL